MKIKAKGKLLDTDVSYAPRCQECDGICCRSFPTVYLSESEYHTLRELGAQRLHFTMSGKFLLIIENGCEFQVDGRCSIYAHRPSICRRFICDA